MNDGSPADAGSVASNAAQWRGRPLHGILFDLDGTLLDTAADIAGALNRSLAERGWPALKVTDVVRMIGRGAPILIERAAALQNRAVSAADKAQMVERFFHFYGALEERDESAAVTYPDVPQTLRLVHEAGLSVAIVTNKQERFARALLHRLELAGWVDLVVGGDTCERRKPDPQPLLFACSALRLTPDQVLMVGDSVNDVSAARAAGIPVVCVPYGYNEGQDPRTLQCDALIDTLKGLPSLVGLTVRAEIS